ncbi:MAG: TIGR02594 family protein [Rhizobiales bacterium]|nr:TIGR02594 family protein [Hyphomicrobiales bacterium]
MTTKEIQIALKSKGFDPGPIDGVRGRRTIAAIMAFQAKNNLEVDGIVGPLTAAKLFAGGPAPTDTVVPSTQPWMTEALRLIGVKEDTSSGSNPVIIGWGKKLSIAYGNDEIPWCGLFVAHCVGSQLPDEALPNNPLGARNWSKLGIECEPQLGAVLVFWRESKASGKGHVGFYVAEDSTAYHVLGGNQSNAVNVKRVGKDRFLNARWPSSAPAPTGQRRFANSTGRLSDNEA